MNTHIVKTLAAFAALLSASVPSAFSAGADVCIAVSPHLSQTEKEEARDLILTAVLQELPQESRIKLMDGWTAEVITDLSVPSLKYDGIKARQQALRQSLAHMLKWLARPAEEQELAGSGALDLPKLADRIERSKPETLLLIGSPIYLNKGEPKFSWKQADGPNKGFWYPSDSFLFAPVGASPWNAQDAEKLDSVTVHWLTLGDIAFPSGAYAGKVQRFYSLFISLQGGKLVSFMDDGGQIFKDLPRTDLEGDRYEVKAAHGPATMSRVENEIIFASVAENVAQQEVPLDLNPRKIVRVTCIDVTLSMEPVYSEVARRLAMMPDGENMLLITFSDHGGPHRVVTVFEESDDPSVLSRSLRSIELVDGVEIPEAIGDALHAVREELQARGVAEPIEIQVWTDSFPKEASEVPTGIDYREELTALLQGGHKIKLIQCAEDQPTDWVPDGVTIEPLF